MAKPSPSDKMITPLDYLGKRPDKRDPRVPTRVERRLIERKTRRDARSERRRRFREDNSK